MMMKKKMRIGICMVERATLVVVYIYIYVHAFFRSKRLTVQPACSPFDPPHSQSSNVS